MLLSLSRGPSVAESYQGFSSAPLGRGGGDVARRRLDVTLLLMIATVAVGAVLGVGLGLNAPPSPTTVAEKTLDSTAGTAKPLMTGFGEAPDLAASYPALANEFTTPSKEAPPRAPVASSSRNGPSI